ncbi:rhodanese-like domain-containing protein [Jeotgalibaca sp. A127]|uniref:rhodanese-like domain-containing protein n=1 Tax=Jeotgalibaca sp. A127 TaxID=3457324 RepID=UPI003FD45541
MKKLNYPEIADAQIIDIRSQLAFQNGHAKGSLNLTAKNFKKYAGAFLSQDQPLAFVVGEEAPDEIAELETIAREMGYAHIAGFLVIDEIPKEAIQHSDTITAADFLKKESDFILLDVRHPDEITRPAPEKNLVNIALEDLAANYQDLAKNKDVYTLCGSGNRGTTAASYLETKGFQPIIIEGGMKAIQETMNP